MQYCKITKTFIKQWLIKIVYIWFILVMVYTLFTNSCRVTFCYLQENLLYNRLCFWKTPSFITAMKEIKLFVVVLKQIATIITFKFARYHGNDMPPVISVISESRNRESLENRTSKDNLTIEVCVQLWDLYLINKAKWNQWRFMNSILVLTGIANPCIHTYENIHAHMNMHQKHI